MNQKRHELRGVLITSVLVVMFPAITILGASDLEIFKSDAGGYEVLVPAAWHKHEIPADGVYQAALSRESIEGGGGPYVYGLSIVRLKNYRTTFQFDTRDSSQMALEYATRVTSAFQEGQNTVIAIPTTGHGFDTSLFRIVAAGGTDACLSMWLLVGIQDKQWFHALWEIPCGERNEHEAEIDQMIESLAIDTKWAKHK